MQRSCIQSSLAHSMNAAALHAIKNWIPRNFAPQNSKDDAKERAPGLSSSLKDDAGKGLCSSLYQYFRHVIKSLLAKSLSQVAFFVLLISDNQKLLNSP